MGGRGREIKGEAGAPPHRTGRRGVRGLARRNERPQIGSMGLRRAALDAHSARRGDIRPWAWRAAARAPSPLALGAPLLEHVATPVDALTWSEVVVRLSSMQARRDPVLVANQSLLPGLRSEMLPGLRVALRDSQSVMFLKIEGRIINVNFSKLPD